MNTLLTPILGYSERQWTLPQETSMFYPMSTFVVPKTPCIIGEIAVKIYRADQ